MTRRLWFGSLFAGLRKPAKRDASVPEASAWADMELAETLYNFMKNPQAFQHWPENKVIGHIAALIRYRNLDEVGTDIYLHAADNWNEMRQRSAAISDLHKD